MSIKSKVLQITDMAMDVTEAGVAHVFVDYSGHVNGLYVSAYPTDTDYQLAYRDPIFGCSAYLNTTEYRTEEDVSNRLDSIITRLTALKEQKA